MTCSCGNAGRRATVPATSPARLFVFSDDERIGRQLELLGHTVFVVRPSRHPEGATEAMLTRFRADAVVTDRADGRFGDLPRIDVRLPDTCDDCAPMAHQPAIAERLTVAVAGVAASGDHNRRNVIISGYYGAKNTGDNLLLEAIAQALTAADPSVHVSVAATNPTEVERSHGLPAYARKDLHLITPHLDSCTAFVLGGGGLWNDYNFNELGGVTALFDHPIASIPGWTQTQLLAQLLGVQTCAFGLGVGPLSDDGARKLVQLAASGMQLIVVRDDTSRHLLDELGVHADVAPDPVYGLTLPDGVPPVSSRRYIALNLRDWQFSNADYLAQLRDALVTWCRRESGAIVGVPMQPSDVKTLQSFLATLPDGIDHSVLRWQHDPTEAIDVLRSSLFVIAMRLHTCLIAHRLQRAVVGLAYDPKVREHFEELGRAPLALELTSSAEQMGDAIAEAMHGLPANTITRINELETAACAGLHELAQRVASLPPKRIPETRTYPRVPAPVSAAEPATRKGFLGRVRG